MEKYYSFAGVELAVNIPDDRMYTADLQLAKFRQDSLETPHLFRFQIVDMLDAPEGICIVADHGFHVYRRREQVIRYIGSTKDSWADGYCRVSRIGRKYDVQLSAKQCPGEIGAKVVLNAIGAEHLIVQAGGVVFHCSYIEHEGQAILFTAPSGTGKSTQADLWNALRGTTIINGDRAAIRVVDGMVYACGIPFAGSSVHCLNRTLPLKAIVYLAQAPTTTIRALRGYEAFSRIWEGCSINTWDPEDMALASDTVAKVANTVPVFYLPCTPDESAVTALEQALKGER